MSVKGPSLSSQSNDCGKAKTRSAGESCATADNSDWASSALGLSGRRMSRRDTAPVDEAASNRESAALITVGMTPRKVRSVRRVQTPRAPAREKAGAHGGADAAQTR